MLRSMRFQVDVDDELEDPLRRLARNDHRSVREHGTYLLNVKIREELARLKNTLSVDEPIAEVA